MARRERERGREENAAEPRQPVYTASFKVARSDELLPFLLRKCNTSRNNVKTFLTRRLVLVNGSVVTRHDFILAKDDEVKISKTPVLDGAPQARRTPKTPVRRRVDVKILYEDGEFIAIDKPAGLLSVESDKETESAYSCVYALMRARGDTGRPFILHRIDKETSGVLVFAKDVKIHSKMKMRWNELVKTREYYAVTEGVPKKKEATLVHYLKENKNNLVYATNDPTGQKAITRYAVEKENAEYALLKVEIDTGRKNQIRVQLHAEGTPIVGDDKYGHTKNPLKRLGLHASKLVFEHPDTGEQITIVSTLPPSFRAIF